MPSFRWRLPPHRDDLGNSARQLHAVGVQSYNIKLEPRAALTRCMATWRKFTATP